MTLLLAGVAVSMFLGAMTSGILTFMNEYRLREFLFWMVGGLDFRRWEHVFLAAGLVLVGITVLTSLARHLNVLVLGEDEAKAVGMPVVLIRLILLFVASTTAAAVCVSGSIGFVGLVVPHIMRLLLGPEHRTLLPACALAGALFLISCDTLGRLVAAPAEIRVGIVTALTGAPYSLFLLRKAQKGEAAGHDERCFGAGGGKHYRESGGAQKFYPPVRCAQSAVSLLALSARMAQGKVRF